MAEATSHGPHLKYLGFLRVAFLRTLSYLVSLYHVAKASSGVLEPGLDRVEGTVRTVVGPVIAKFQDKPDQLLDFVDGKVDAIFQILDEYTPDFVKAKTFEVYDAAKSTPETFEKTSLSLLEGAKVYGYKGWKAFLVLPLAPQIVKLSTPTALFAGKKYNKIVDYVKSTDIPVVKSVAYYLPEVPVHEIAKTVKADVDSALKAKKSD